jgi:PAS domain S-box-containing protein
MNQAQEPPHSERDRLARASRLQALFDSIDEGFCVAEIVIDELGEAVDYRFLEVNPLFEQMTGLVDPVGKTALELVPDLERAWINKYARVALDGETLRFEQGSGAMGRWFDVFATPVSPRGQFAIVFKDQTARRRWETALQESESRFRSMADHLPLPVWQHDARGRQDWVNETFSTYFGVTREEMVDDRWQLLTHPEDGESYAKEFTEAVAERSPFHGLARVRRADGEWRWLESWAHPTFGPDGDYRGHLGTSADVTERALAEEIVGVRANRSALMAELLTELDGQPRLHQRIRTLVQLLVNRIADYAIIEAPFEPEPLVAVAHRDPNQVENLVELHQYYRLDPESPLSITIATDKGQLLSVMDPHVRSPQAYDPDAAACILKLNPRSQIAVPLDLGAHRRGALILGLVGREGRHFGHDDLAFVEDVARRMGVVFATARVHEQEHDISVRLQKALLPDKLVQHDRLDIVARYQAASDILEVGGDWYDTFSWPDGSIGIIVGDVVGHGLDSVASMGRLRAATAALAAHIGPRPAELLTALDEFAKGSDGTDFATAVCVVIDPDSGRLTYASAGHPPIIVVEPNGATRRLEEALSLPLCRIDAGERHEATTILLFGSLVILYSDGLIERRREHLDVGLGRLEEASSKLRELPAASLADRLIADLAASSAPEDDVVVVCARWTVNSAPPPPSEQDPVEGSGSVEGYAWRRENR